MKLGVVGGGVVGQATARCFIEHVEEVRVYDVVKERRTHPLDDVLDCDLVFVSLPTPQKAGALECDVSFVEAFFHKVGRVDGVAREGTNKVNYVLRSTVPIGTTRRLHDQYDLPNLCHSPEFLTARCAVVDAQMPSRNIIGVPQLYPEVPAYSACFYKLEELYNKRFPGVPLHVTSSDESEAVKVFQNSIFAVTVSLWNELRQLADKAGLDWDRVRNAILADGRISNSHTRVPGPDGYGFAGSCLPKDLASFVDQYRELVGENAWVTKAALCRNEQDRKRK